MFCKRTGETIMSPKWFEALLVLLIIIGAVSCHGIILSKCITSFVMYWLSKYSSIYYSGTLV